LPPGAAKLTFKNLVGEAALMNELPRWKKWFLALRPFSYTAAVVPCALGGLLALSQGDFNWPAFFLTIIGGVLLQMGTNMVNTYYDFVNGLDTPENSAAVNPAVVLGWVRPGQILLLGYLAFAAAALIGIYLVSLGGVAVLVLGAIGVVFGYIYTATPLAYKYFGLGVPMVFVLMGPLMVAGGYVVQTGVWRWEPLAISLPVAFLVAGILHGNDLRDMPFDGEKIATLANWLGEKGSERLYEVIIGGAFISLVVLVLTGLLTPWSLLALLMLPRGLQLVSQVHRGFLGQRELLGPIEPLTARLHMQFGALMILGVVLSNIL